MRTRRLAGKEGQVRETSRQIRERVSARELKSNAAAMRVENTKDEKVFSCPPR